jgi:hypothetical protein
MLAGIRFSVPSVRMFRHTDIREHEPRLERKASADLRSRTLIPVSAPSLGCEFPVQGTHTSLRHIDLHNTLSCSHVGGFVNSIQSSCRQFMKPPEYFTKPPTPTASQPAMSVSFKCETDACSLSISNRWLRRAVCPLDLRLAL